MGVHSISRFVDRRHFLIDDLDRDALLDAITLASDRWDWVWLSYAAMSNHVHYGHLAGSRDPDDFFRSAHGRFAGQYHRRRGGKTLGPVFADRPKMLVVRSPDLLRVVAYHHRNPVEAGVVELPRQSTWTSHRAYLRLDPAPVWLDVERALDILGFVDTAAGRRHFDEFVTEVDLGDRNWERQSAPFRQVVPREGTANIEWERLAELARRVVGLPAPEPLTSRRRTAARARLLIGLIATRDFHQTYAVVAARLGMRTGSLFNLLARGATDPCVDSQLHELRRLLSAI